ncbi:Fic family protein [Legionella cardiaca]|uniref:Fic family protein n=1 Tax=Legionella cardiaca TaxID=1071983 RepID=A0ABY8ARS4_9GAMM|nr:Fic family protein [Legionella cardiaca]WED42911.1 Fic family protein [Legionella cardiaca]
MYVLSDLTEFNHALIYAFEPESSPRRLMGSETFIDALLPEAGQHEDMLAAYLYAQNTILPFIRENGWKKVDEKLFLEWINTLHGFIGNTLLSTHGRKAGQYTEELVLRWHKGSQLSTEFILFLSDSHTIKNKNKFILHLVELGLDKDDASSFLNLLLAIKTNKSLKPHPSQLPFIDPQSPFISGILTLQKLAVAYHGNQLKAKEKACVDRVVKICRMPIELPAAMDSFAKETLQGLRELGDRQERDLAEVAAFLGRAFYNFTDIHPFGNANGRTGTCLINIFLRSFDLPSILLRHPGEKENANSNYAKAIAELDHSLQPLNELILHRILVAQKETFADEQLKQIISLRVALSTVLQRIHKKHPSFDLESLRDKISPSILLAANFSEDMNATSLLLLTSLLAIADEEEKRLDATKIKPLLPPVMNIEEKQNLLQALEKLTGQTGWAISNGTGLAAWIKQATAEQAEQTFKTLESLDLGTVTILDIKTGDGQVQSVVQCKNVNVKKLLALAEKTPTLDTASSNVHELT